MSDEPRHRALGRGLGRGLSSLLGDEDAAPKNLRSVATELLHPGRFQPRRNFDEANLQSLADSIRAQGILQPILVRRSPENPSNYEILAGERRWRAAQAVQLHEVPVVVRELGDREASEIALVENIQRQDLNPIEEAQGYKRLVEEFGHTQEALAEALGKSRSHIANTLRLLNLPDEIQAMIADGRLTAGHARALITARDPMEIAKEIISMGLSVRQTEGYVRDQTTTRQPKTDAVKPAAWRDPNVVALEQELSLTLGLKVTIETTKSEPGGTLSIRYHTLDQLDAVLKKLRSPW